VCANIHATVQENRRGINVPKSFMSTKIKRPSCESRMIRLSSRPGSQMPASQCRRPSSSSLLFTEWSLFDLCTALWMSGHDMLLRGRFNWLSNSSSCAQFSSPRANFRCLRDEQCWSHVSLRISKHDYRTSSPLQNRQTCPDSSHSSLV